MQSAAHPEPCVDPRLVEEFASPLAVQSVAPGRERVAGKVGVALGSRRKDARGRPGGRVVATLAGQHADGVAAAGEFPRDRQPDNAPADDAAIGHA
jgi:hypothetical protein